MAKSSNQKDKPFTFVDIFAGCGGLSAGLFNAGWQGLFAIERDVNAFATLEVNLLGKTAQKKFAWPKWLPQTHHNVMDVLQTHSEELSRLAGTVDMLVGGPPCQGFSSAGRRDAKDPRNKLTEAYLEFVDLIKPKLVLIENVRGITLDFEDEDDETGKVNYARWIINELSKEYIVFTKLLDTSTFGVPQKRHRFFIIAVAKTQDRREKIDPFEVIEQIREGFVASKGLHLPVSARCAISDLEVNRNGKRASVDTAKFEEISYMAPLTSYQRLMNGTVGNRVTDTRLARHKPEISSRFAKIIDICHQQGRLNVSLSAELKASFNLKKKAIRVLDPDSPSPTITSMPDDLIHYHEPRTLTVRENARLQSFPDSFVFKGKYTSGGDRRKSEVPRFTQVANAVPPLAAEAIGKALLQYLESLQGSRGISNSHRSPQRSRDAEAAAA